MKRDQKKQLKQRVAKPKASSLAALMRMKAAKPRDTAPEKEIRARIHQMGLRYRVDARPIKALNRRADILFRSIKVAIFIDGCFWHGCPVHGTKAKANAEFWNSKIQQNQERDLDTNRQLKNAGWTVIRIWEHEDTLRVSEKIFKTIKKLEMTKTKA